MNDATFQGNGEITWVPVVLNAKQQKPPSNADRLRAMSDEELADYLANICYDLWNMFVADPKKMWLDWLRQEASDG